MNIHVEVSVNLKPCDKQVVAGNYGVVFSKEFLSEPFLCSETAGQPL